VSHYNVKPIRLDFKPSRRLLLALGFAAPVAITVLAILPVSLWIKLLAISVVVSMASYHILDAMQRLPRSCVSLSLDTKGAWQLVTRDGNRYDATILASSFVAPYMTILNCSLTGRWLQYHIVILPDAVDGDAFRRLRVWLRWGRQASTADDA
jgi:toxin CptA